MIHKKFTIIFIVSLFLFTIFTPIKADKYTEKFEGVGFFRLNHNPIYIEGDNDFIKENGVVSGNGTQENPFIISNWNIRISLKDNLFGNDAISIKNTKSYFIIENCYIHFIDGKFAFLISKTKLFSGCVAINLFNVSNGKIKNCYISGMKGAITIENNSHNNLVLNCNCWRNFHGIGINRGSTNNTIESCYNRNYRCGICLWDNTSNNLISNCNCKKTGINIFKSSNNTVKHCKVSFCLSYPAMNVFNNSDYNIIESCNFYHSLIGLKIFDGSNGNVIYKNNFVRNKKHGFDEDTNQWDNGSYGNYWSDFEDVDENKDGIWDHQRQISGGCSIDRYPLVNPTY